MTVPPRPEGGAGPHRQAGAFGGGVLVCAGGERRRSW